MEVFMITLVKKKIVNKKNRWAGESLRFEENSRFISRVPVVKLNFNLFKINLRNHQKNLIYK